ncbi:LPS export ABC transporter periplasmic protein LptC [Prevotella sp. 10(H)]|uniref:LPS export ABC transporter periplasmic protein LptC n=1 Tax=Prevotella sp. 10(H) TaxID=1158294 RepID=UPI0004A6FC7D|nr:LPS export ABC transporter periplasmic protein LptC [Prevotella sp. 10(H)]
MKLTLRQVITISIVFFIFSVPFFFASCNKDDKSGVNFVYDKETVPSMHTDSVRMLISDSGLIKYKMITKTWNMYDEAKDPYWFFPDGLYLEQFDTAFQVVVTVVADTAWNYTRKDLWRLKGNVFVRNILGETFSGDELFWNRKQEKIYSDKLVEINRPEKGILIAKNGLVANQQMTEYEFMNVGEKGDKKTLFYVNEEEEKGEEKTE